MLVVLSNEARPSDELLGLILGGSVEDGIALQALPRLVD